MKYKASDIITKARQIADLTNSEFLSWNEEVSMLNDAYTMLYQKLVNINDGSFVKTIVLQPGMNILPQDFWQLRSVYVDRNGNIEMIKRRAASESMNVLSYEIKLNHLTIYGTIPFGTLVMEYWASPATLTFKPKPVQFGPLPSSTTTPTPYACYDEKYFYTIPVQGAPASYLDYYDFETNDTVTLIQLYQQGIQRFLPSKEKAVVWLTDNTVRILDYKTGTNTTITDIPFFTESGTLGLLGTDNKGKINNHSVFEWEYDTDISFVVCNDNFSDFYYLKDNTIYHNGEQVLVNEETVSATSLMYANGNCWYSTSNEVGFIDYDNNLHIISVSSNILGINKIDCNTGFGYSIKNDERNFTVYPWVEDTELDFPNSMYFQIMAYMLAVQYKIKQGADSSGIMTVLGTLENTFYDTLTQDANDFVRIKNVY